jgi:hypothetical protein
MKYLKKVEAKYSMLKLKPKLETLLPMFQALKKGNTGLSVGVLKNHAMEGIGMGFGRATINFYTKKGEWSVDPGQYRPNEQKVMVKELAATVAHLNKSDIRDVFAKQQDDLKSLIFHLKNASRDLEQIQSARDNQIREEDEQHSKNFQMKKGEERLQQQNDEKARRERSRKSQDRVNQDNDAENAEYRRKNAPRPNDLS